MMHYNKFETNQQTYQKMQNLHNYNIHITIKNDICDNNKIKHAKFLFFYQNKHKIVKILYQMWINAKILNIFLTSL